MWIENKLVFLLTRCDSKKKLVQIKKTPRDRARIITFKTTLLYFENMCVLCDYQCYTCCERNRISGEKCEIINKCIIFAVR